jgi:hypothetical protein
MMRFMQWKSVVVTMGEAASASFDSGRKFLGMRLRGLSHSIAMLCLGSALAVTQRF